MTAFETRQGMLMKLHSKITAAIILSIFSLTSHASNFSFFGNSAISFYTKEDWKIAKSAQITALNQIQDGVKLIWANPRTGSHGIFLPMHTYHARSGSLCRQMEILHTANRVNDKAVYRFCKMKNEWKIV